MKKTLRVFTSRVSAIIILLAIVGGFFNKAQAQSNVSTGAQISSFTGNASDFTNAGYVGYADQGGNGVTYYIGFDASYLYVGAFRTGNTFGGSDNLTVYIDIDPNATPTSGTGTTAGQSYNSVTGTLPFTANYDAHLEGSYYEMRNWTGSVWNATAILTSNYGVWLGSNTRELKIPLSTIGNPNALYVTCWMGYAGGTYANAPGTNVGGSNPTTVGYFGGFGLSSTGCNPTTSINTAITASCINAAPAAGATYGYVSETSGPFTAAGNFNVANGGSINIGGGTLALGANTVTMGQTGLTTGNAATLNYSSGTINTGTLNFVSNGYFTGSAATVNNVTINTGTVNLTAVPTINGTLLINGGNVSAAPVYGASSTLAYGGTYTRYIEWSATAPGTIGTTAGYPNNVNVNSGTLTLYNSGQTGGGAMAGTMTISSGTTFTMAGYGTGTMSVGKNWSDAGTFTPGTGTISMAGGAAQTITKTGGETFYGLTINNTSGGVSLSNPVTVTNALTLTSGVVTTTSSNTLSVTNTATSGISGGSTTAYVSGPLNWTLPASLTASGSVYIFPVGGTAYLPFTLTTLTTGSTGPIIQVQATNSSAGGSVNGTLSAISTSEYWAASVVSGNYTSGAIGLTQSTAISPYNVVAQSSSQSGTYVSIAGTASADAVSGSNVETTLGYFTFGTKTSPPVITSVIATSPLISGQANNSGYVGQNITITGTNLGSATVTVGGAGVTLVSNTATAFTFVCTSGSIAGTVSLTTSAGTATQGGFTNLGYITNASADWATGSTWLGGSVPPAGATTTVNNTVGISTSVANAPASITINSSESLTLNNASSAITTTTVTNNGTLAWTAAGTLTIAAGGTLSNAGTFTGGTGTVNFAGAGTVSGSSTTFNNLTINTGTVTLATTPTINGNLQINGGNVSAAPTYGTGSALIYNVASYTAYNEWTGGSPSGSGVPYNVIIGNGTNSAVNFGSSANYYQLNGSLTIASGSSLTQSSNGSSAGLKFGINLTNNGTYADNGRGTWFL